MIALFDSGSSKLHFSWWEGEAIKKASAIPYPESPVLLRDTVSNLLGGTVPDKVAACSVSSKWREPLFKAIQDVVPGTLSIARTASDLGVIVSYDKPETYGIDRALASYAAFQIFQGSCVVIDAGTAVTLDIIAPDGTVSGGFIFPGMDMLASSLSNSTDLPEVFFDNANEKIGKSTISSITSGITIGFYGAVNRLINHAVEIAGSKATVVITGGNAESLKQHLTIPVEHKPHLVLEALGHVVDILPKYTLDCDTIKPV